MSLPSFLHAHADGTRLAIKLHPRARRNSIGESAGDELKIQITAPPVDSAANDALLRWLAEILDCPRNSVQLLRGRTSRHKSIAITGLPPATVLARLQSSRQPAPSHATAPDPPARF